MMFEAYKISETHYQLHMMMKGQRIWLASFNKLHTLVDYYIHCHNLSNDTLKLTGINLNPVERDYFEETAKEWKIRLEGK